MLSKFSFVFFGALFFSKSLASVQKIPFDHKLKGNTYEAQLYNCGYPRGDTSQISIYHDRLVFMSSKNNEDRGAAYTGLWFCQGKEELFFKRRPKQMKIIKTSQETAPFLYDDYGNPGSHQGPSCSELQKVETYYPWGPTRKAFIASLQEIYSGALYIRNSTECSVSSQMPSDIEAFLYTVAYDYYIDLS